MTEFVPTKHENRQPQPESIDKRIRRHVTGRIRDYFAVTPPGFEPLCRQELVELGMDPEAMTIAPGGVGFSGRLVDCQRANLHLHTATRILMRIDTFTATNLRQLEKKTAGTAWELFLAPNAMPRVKVSSHRSRLYHTAAIAQTIQAGMARRLNGALQPETLSQTLFVRVVDDRFSLSLDSSGPALYKRGYKTGAARAPIRETLAAAILMTAGYDPARPLVDPMCGAGTFSLEAAMMAKHVAPGANRDFAFMGWPAFAANPWAFLKRQAHRQMVVLDRPRIFASDLDADACGRLRDAVAGSDLADAVRVFQQDFFDCRGDQYGDRPGWVVINPPYGIRLGSARRSADLFRAICAHLVRHFNGWHVALIAPQKELLRHLPFPAQQLPLLHGGLKLTLVMGLLAAD